MLVFLTWLSVEEITITGSNETFWFIISINEDVSKDVSLLASLLLVSQYKNAISEYVQPEENTIQGSNSCNFV